MSDATGAAATPDNGVGTKKTNGQTTIDASAAAGKTPPKLSPEALKQINSIRAKMQGLIGQVVMALSIVPRYRHQTLADLQHLVADPMMCDRIAIATAKTEDEAANPESMGTMAGIAFWASVSDAVDAKIREQIKAGVFPIRLKAEDWSSGDKVWLLDVVAPSQRLATAVLANFKQVAKQGEVRIAPIAARQVDPELLKKMGAVADGAQAS